MIKVLHNEKGKKVEYIMILERKKPNSMNIGRPRNDIKLNMNIMVINGVSTAMSLGNDKNWQKSASG